MLGLLQCGGRYPAAGTACNNTRWNLSPDGVSSGGESSGGGGGSASKERCSLAEDAATTTASAFFNNYTPSSSTAATGGGGSPPIGGGFGGGQEGSLIPGRAFTHLQQVEMNMYLNIAACSIQNIWGSLNLILPFFMKYTTK